MLLFYERINDWLIDWLIGDRGTCVLTTCPGLHSTAERVGFEPATDSKSSIPTTRPPRHTHGTPASPNFIAPTPYLRLYRMTQTDQTQLWYHAWGRRVLTWPGTISILRVWGFSNPEFFGTSYIHAPIHGIWRTATEFVTIMAGKIFFTLSTTSQPWDVVESVKSVRCLQ